MTLTHFQGDRRVWTGSRKPYDSICVRVDWMSRLTSYFSFRRHNSKENSASTILTSPVRERLIWALMAFPECKDQMTAGLAGKLCKQANYCVARLVRQVCWLCSTCHQSVQYCLASPQRTKNCPPTPHPTPHPTRLPLSLSATAVYNYVKPSVLASSRLRIEQSVDLLLVFLFCVNNGLLMQSPLDMVEVEKSVLS